MLRNECLTYTLRRMRAEAEADAMHEALLVSKSTPTAFRHAMLPSKRSYHKLASRNVRTPRPWKANQTKTLRRVSNVSGATYSGLGLTIAMKMNPTRSINNNRKHEAGSNARHSDVRAEMQT